MSKILLFIIIIIILIIYYNCYNINENYDNVITFDNIINSDNVITPIICPSSQCEEKIIKFDNINTILKIPQTTSNCYLVTKKYMLDDNNIPNFKYDFKNFKDDKCNYDLYNLNSNQQLLFDDDINKIDINLIGSCRYGNKECIDFFDKKTCDKYNMVWSNKTCNENLKVKPLQKCEDDYLYNSIDNNCIKCPKEYSFIDNNCIKKPYTVNNYSMLNINNELDNNNNYDSIINNINNSINNIHTVNKRLELCNQENNNNCEIINFNQVSVKCENNDEKIGDLLCKSNSIKPEIKNISDTCPENYIYFNSSCVNIN